jgi:hypothetical protein
MKQLAWLVRMWGAACLVMMLGCVSPKPNLKPPKEPEKFNLPPDADARYVDPVKYPEGTPRAAQLKRWGPDQGGTIGASTTPGMTNPGMYQGGSSGGRPY